MKKQLPHQSAEQQSNELPTLDVALVRWQQRLMLATVITVITAIFAALIVLLSDRSNPVAESKPLTKDAFSTIDYAHSQQAWLSGAQKQIVQLKDTLESLHSRVRSLEEPASANESSALDPHIAKDNTPSESNTPLGLTKSEALVPSLVNQASHYFNPLQDDTDDNSSAHNPREIKPQDNFPQEPQSAEHFFVMQRLDLSLQKKQNTSQLPFIPAGTYVKAALLGGVDAPANTMSQTNPEPILLRLIEDAHLPGKQTVSLKNCMVTAAVVGDISSERGHIRLERLSCSFDNKRFELDIEGTVFGSDGKNGVRGQPAWREGKRLQRAAMAGFLSGVGSQLPSAPHALESNTLNNKSMISQGLVQGASSALDRLAQYHIKRAENYHPIIQIDAGKTVDVVFLKGFYLTPQQKELF